MASKLARVYGPLGLLKPIKVLPDYFIEKLSIYKELRKLNYKMAKRIVSRFDPFHNDVKSVREFCAYTSAERYKSTNPSCALKTEICCDRSDPTIIVTLAENNHKITFKTKNLTCLELLRLFNKHVSSLYVPEEKEETLTKSMSKSAATFRRK